MSYQVSYDDGDVGAGFSVEAFSLPEAVAKARQFRTLGRQNIVIQGDGGMRLSLAEAEQQAGGFADG